MAEEAKAKALEYAKLAKVKAIEYFDLSVAQITVPMPFWTKVVVLCETLAVILTGSLALIFKYGAFCNLGLCLPTLGMPIPAGDITSVIGGWGARQVAGAVPFLAALYYNEKILYKVAMLEFVVRCACDVLTGLIDWTFVFGPTFAGVFWVLAIATNGSLVGLALYALEKKGPDWSPLKGDEGAQGPQSDELM